MWNEAWIGDIAFQDETFGWMWELRAVDKLRWVCVLDVENMSASSSSRFVYEGIARGDMIEAQGRYCYLWVFETKTRVTWMQEVTTTVPTPLGSWDYIGTECDEFNVFLFNTDTCFMKDELSFKSWILGNLQLGNSKCAPREPRGEAARKWLARLVQNIFTI